MVDQPRKRQQTIRPLVFEVLATDGVLTRYRLLKRIKKTLKDKGERTRYLTPYLYDLLKRLEKEGFIKIKLEPWAKGSRKLQRGLCSLTFNGFMIFLAQQPTTECEWKHGYSLTYYPVPSIVSKKKIDVLLEIIERNGKALVYPIFEECRFLFEYLGPPSLTIMRDIARYFVLTNFPRKKSKLEMISEEALRAIFAEHIFAWLGLTCKLKKMPNKNLLQLARKTLNKRKEEIKKFERATEILSSCHVNPFKSK